jgi:hypothetical protein
MELISRSFGKKVLSSYDNYKDLDCFIKEFQESVVSLPNVSISLCHLEGLYLIQEIAMKKTIRYFPKNILPFDAKGRFQELFVARSKWDKNDILPFVKDLAGNDKELDRLILKHSRVSRFGKTIFLTNRHAVVPE